MFCVIGSSLSLLRRTDIRDQSSAASAVHDAARAGGSGSSAAARVSRPPPVSGVVRMITCTASPQGCAALPRRAMLRRNPFGFAKDSTAMDTPLATLSKSAGKETRHVHILKQLERKLLWLSAWMIHNANHIRPNRDGLKVGGHQASCASCISILAALYLEVARPQDRLAIKPHAGPVFHAMNYLFGRQTREKLGSLRQFGGIQPYPSRVKDG